MAFRNVLLPGTISSGASSTPMWQTDVARTPAGYEKRVGRRSDALRKCVAPLNIRTLNQLHELLAHFNVMQGPYYSFPFLDRLDNRSCAPETTPAVTDSLLGTGDGVTAAFQCRKGYTSGAYTHYRTILLPKQTTLLVSVAGVLKTETTHYTVNYETGVITFTGGNIPSAAQEVKAGFEFYCKVRYDTNDLQTVIEAYRTGSIPSIALIEVYE